MKDVCGFTIKAKTFSDAVLSDVAISACEVLRDMTDEEDDAEENIDAVIAFRDIVRKHGLKAVLEAVRDSADCGADAIEGGLFSDEDTAGAAGVLREISAGVTKAIEVIK